MNVFVATDFRCTLYNNKVYLDPKAYTILERYSKGFDKIILWSRVEKKETIPSDYREAYYIREIIPIKDLFTLILGNYDKVLEDRIKEADIVICRLPSIPGIKAGEIARKNNKVILSEVMSDAWAAHWYHSFKGKVIAPYMEYMTKKILRYSSFGIYVTQKFLQKKYPCGGESVGVSNVVLKDVSADVLETRLQKLNGLNNKEFSLLTVADVGIASKGHRFVIRALKELKKFGITPVYYMAGAGNYDHLENEAKKLDVSNQVVFLGRLTKNEVEEWLQKTDIYIHPSLQEGLPRAVIEAMGYAVPIYGSDTAGIPELLDDNYVFRRKNTKDIVEKLIDLDIDELKKQAKRNFLEAKKYEENKLNSRRNEFFARICKFLKDAD